MNTSTERAHNGLLTYINSDGEAISQADGARAGIALAFNQWKPVKIGWLTRLCLFFVPVADQDDRISIKIWRGKYYR